MEVLKPLRLYTHTHTHTVYCLLENKIDVKKVEYKKKDRTMLKIENIGLSLCVFTKKYLYIERFIYIFIIRAGPFVKYK